MKNASGVAERAAARVGHVDLEPGRSESEAERGKPSRESGGGLRPTVLGAEAVGRIFLGFLD